MARQAHSLKITGTIGDVTYLKLNGNYIARKKSSLNADRVASDPAFKNSRGASSEFGKVSQAGKFFRQSLGAFTSEGSGKRLADSVMELLNSIKNTVDRPTGERTITAALQDPEAVKAFEGFEFNQKSQVGRFFGSNDVQLLPGRILMDDFCPVLMKAPKGATHIVLSCCAARLDFEKQTSALSCSEELLFDAKNTKRVKAELSFELPADGPGILLYLLKVTFVIVQGGRVYLSGNSRGNGVVVVRAEKGD